MALGPAVPGVDAKLNIANSTIAGITRGLEVEQRGLLGVDSGMSDVQNEQTNDASEQGDKGT